MTWSALGDGRYRSDVYKHHMAEQNRLRYTGLTGL